MDNHMRKERKWGALRTGLLTAAAVMLVLSAVMGSAWAYFTTYTKAKGGYVLHMGHEEHVDEEFSNWNKKINITFTEDSKPVYIRARAFCADYALTLSDEEVQNDGDEPVNENWVPAEDGWMYYTKVYRPQKDKDGNMIAADPLFVRINNVPKSEMEGIRKGDEFNVIIVYETTEVQYDSAGNPLPWDQVDWTKKVDVHRTSGTKPEDVQYVGNNSTMIFHVSTCSDVDKMNDEHKVFKSRTELVKEGYEPCEHCNP